MYFSSSSVDSLKHARTVESTLKSQGRPEIVGQDPEGVKITAEEATQAFLSEQTHGFHRARGEVRGGGGCSESLRATDMTYISLHLNQLWVQLRNLVRSRRKKDVESGGRRSDF